MEKSSSPSDKSGITALIGTGISFFIMGAVAFAAGMTVMSMMM